MPVYVIGSGETGAKAMAKMLANGIDAVLISEEEADRKGMMIRKLSMIAEEKTYTESFKPPLTRAQRRKKKKHGI